MIFLHLYENDGVRGITDVTVISPIATSGSQRCPHNTGQLSTHSETDPKDDRVCQHHYIVPPKPLGPDSMPSSMDTSIYWYVWIWTTVPVNVPLYLEYIISTNCVNVLKYDDPDLRYCLKSIDFMTFPRSRPSRLPRLRSPKPLMWTSRHVTNTCVCMYGSGRGSTGDTPLRSIGCMCTCSYTVFHDIP